MRVIYTDGSCFPTNPGTGGWAFAVSAPDAKVWLTSGSDSWTTNNRMELTAAIEALRSCASGEHVQLHTDSQYVKNGITSWIAKWKRDGWVRGKARKSVLNKDLWQKLDEENQRVQVDWHWVKAHAGNKLNELVDRAARDAADELFKSLPEREKQSIVGVRSTDELRVDGPAYGIAAARYKKGPWAWAYMSNFGDPLDIEARVQPDCSVNETMLLGSIALLRRFPDGSRHAIVLGSPYLYNGLTDWMPFWKMNDWRKGDGKRPVAVELWMALDREASRLDCVWYARYNGPEARNLLDRATIVAEDEARAHAERETSESFR